MDNGSWSKNDTLRKTYGGAVGNAPIVVFQDNLDNPANWDGEWAITTETFHSAPSCMTDSPNGAYLPDVLSACNLLTNASIPANAVGANLRFFAKWAIEEDWDFVPVVAFGQNNFSKPLCGLYTESGVNSQLDRPYSMASKGNG